MGLNTAHSVSWLAVCLLSSYLLPAAISIKCLSCTSDGIVGITCQDTTSYLDCDTVPRPVSNHSYRACYSLMKIVDYPFLGKRTEVEKNCTIEANCPFLQTFKCFDKLNLTVSCSVDCCEGDFCNGNPPASSASIYNSNVVTEPSASESLSWQPSVTPTSGHQSTRPILTISNESSSLRERIDMFLFFVALVVALFQDTMYH